MCTHIHTGTDACMHTHLRIVKVLISIYKEDRLCEHKIDVLQLIPHNVAHLVNNIASLSLDTNTYVDKKFIIDEIRTRDSLCHLS